MIRQQYIGITGFMSQAEVNSVLSSLPTDFGSFKNRKIMVGMLVSGKTIKGIPNKWPNRYPTPDAIPSIFVNDPRVINLVHYNTKEESPKEIINELCLIEDACGPYHHGFQLNMVWPKAQMISDWQQSGFERNKKTIVLQCGGRAMAELNHSPKALAEKLKEYEGVVDYVLLDPSGGIGIPFDPAYALQCLDVIENENLPTIHLGIAGGLSPETLPNLLPPILEHFPKVCIDAEGRLRTKEDNLDLQIANEYINIAENLFRQYAK